MKKQLTIALVALTPALGIAADAEQHRWNLKDLYPTVADWKQDIAKLEGQFKELGACRGKLGSSVARFKTCLDLNADALKRYQRIDSYAQQTHDENTAANDGMELKQTSDVLGNRYNEATAFLRPEILTLGAKKVSAFLAQDKSLVIYRHPLNEILRAAPHTLNAQGEDLIATFGLATGAAQSAYSILANADVPWPTVTLSDGKQVTLNQAAYTKYRSVPNRADRKLVFDAFWGKWKDYERTFGVTLYEQLKRDTAYSKVRKYPDTISQALDDNKIPVAVYDTLVEQTNANLATLHRYFKLRAKLLGIADLRYYDIYPPLVSSKDVYPIEQGKALTLASVKPLGDAYVKAMAHGFDNRWMDVYPRPKKRSGAYMNGAAYDVHPYVLMNYNDDYESVSTLAHEWGHAMHSYLANKAQPFITSDYPIFTAEIASTTNEVLLLDHMLKVAKSDDERLLYLGSALEGLRGTFFRQAMFADFERQIHAKVDKGESLTGEALTKIYGDILRRYHGDKEGVVKIDDAYTVEWAYIPHFYRRFYVYQYATSIAAGSLFAERILKGEPGAVDRFLNVLKAGGGAHPYELVKAAGVDLASPAPYKAVIDRMNKIMDEIEAIQARRK